MKIKNNYKAGILGAVLIATSLYVVATQADYNETMIAGILASGVLLFFVPNRFINLLEKVVIGRVLFDDKKQNENV